MSDQIVEKFHPTSGRVVGVIGLALVAVAFAIGVGEGLPLWGFGVLAAVGVLVWASLLRPRVRIVGEELELRNMFVTEGVPLAAIEEVTVRRLLVVRALDRRFVSPAIGRTLRQTVRPKRHELGGPLEDEGRDLSALADAAYPDYVEHQIRLAARNHREQLGIRNRSSEQLALAGEVRAEPAWLEIAALGLALLVVVLGAVLSF